MFTFFKFSTCFSFLGHSQRHKSEAGSNFSYRYALDLAVLFLLPAIFLNSGLFQLFPMPGSVDAGMYLGYMLDLPTLVERYGLGATTYHATRLSWMLPGYWLHQILPDVVAHYCMVNIMYFASVWSAFFAGAGLAGRTGGYFSAAFIAYSPLFIASVCFGGIDGAVVTYLFLASAFLFAPGAAQLTICRAAGFGATSCLAAIAHPFATTLIGFIGLAYVLINKCSVKVFTRHLYWAFGGAVFTFLLVAWAGTNFGIQFFFPLDSYEMAKRALVGKFGSNYRLPVDEWLHANYRLLIPVILILALSAMAVHFRASNEARSRRCAVIALITLFSVAFLGLWDVLMGGVTLQFRNYTSLSFPIYALAVAELAAFNDKAERRTNSSAMFSITLAVPAFAVAALFVISNDWLDQFTDGYYLFFALVGLTALAITLSFLSPTPLSKVKFLSYSTISLVTISSALNLDSSNIYFGRTNVSLRQAYEGTVGLVNAIKSDANLQDRKIVFWYKRASFSTGNTDTDNKLSYRLRFGPKDYRFNYFDTLSSLYLFDQSLLGDELPRWDKSAYERFLVPYKQKVVLIVLGKTLDDLLLAKTKLHSEGWTPTLRSSYIVTDSDFAYSAWFLDLCDEKNELTSTGLCNKILLDKAHQGNIDKPALFKSNAV